ncbi:MAG: phosphohistidine phosphatase SixA [Candidatus Thiodiazotropha endolucinida]
MKLYLQQHGEACSKEVDPNRPLTEQGRLDTDRIAAILKKAGVQVDRVIHSGKLRAVQTAERLCNTIAPGLALEASGSINPNDNPIAFDQYKEDSEKDILVVGHLPFIAKLVSHLVIGDEDKTIVTFQPGSIVCLERVNDMNWRIDWMIRPELFS